MIHRETQASSLTVTEKMKNAEQQRYLTEKDRGYLLTWQQAWI